MQEEEDCSVGCCKLSELRRKSPLVLYKKFVYKVIYIYIYIYIYIILKIKLNNNRNIYVTSIIIIRRR